MALSTHQLDSNQDIGSLFFKHPSNIFISGPSGSGKTEFVKKMIEFKEDLFDILPQRIVWCYKEWQKSYNILQEREIQNTIFSKLVNKIRSTRTCCPFSRSIKMCV